LPRSYGHNTQGNLAISKFARKLANYEIHMLNKKMITLQRYQ